MASPWDLLRLLDQPLDLLEDSLELEFAPVVTCFPPDVDATIFGLEEYPDFHSMVCVWELGEEDQVWKHYQAGCCAVIALHTANPRDGYYVHPSDKVMDRIVEVVSGASSQVLVFTDQCGECCLRGIVSVKQSDSHVGERIKAQHRHRNGGVRPPSSHLLDDYAVLEFTKVPALNRLKCSRSRNPVIVGPVLCFWDFPLAVKLRLISAVLLSGDAMHPKFSTNWSLFKLFSWSQSSS